MKNKISVEQIAKKVSDKSKVAGAEVNIHFSVSDTASQPCIETHVIVDEDKNIRTYRA